MKRLAVLTLAFATLAAPAWCADQIKATVGQRGNWDTAIIHLGTKAGIFARHNIEVEDYAEFVQVAEPLAKRVRDDFFPKSLVWPDELKGLDTLMPEAVSLKFIPEPLTQAQLAELIQIQGKK